MATECTPQCFHKSPYLNSLNCIQSRVFLLRRRNIAELNLPGFCFWNMQSALVVAPKGSNLTIHTPSLISSPYELTPSCQRIIQIAQSSRNSLSSLPTFVPIVRETLWSCRLGHCIRYTGNFSSRLNTPLASPPKNSAIPIFFFFFLSVQSLPYQSKNQRYEINSPQASHRSVFEVVLASVIVVLSFYRTDIYFAVSS